MCDGCSAAGMRQAPLKVIIVMMQKQSQMMRCDDGCTADRMRCAWRRRRWQSS
jgi:hypothetical protein